MRWSDSSSAIDAHDTDPMADIITIITRDNRFPIFFSP
jgi:hypothetical protein